MNDGHNRALRVGYGANVLEVAFRESDFQKPLPSSCPEHPVKSEAGQGLHLSINLASKIASRRVDQCRIGVQLEESWRLACSRGSLQPCRYPARLPVRR